MDKFIITKTLKGNALTKSERMIEAKKPKEQRTYADRTRIVHAVLADRMADRDHGNKPLSNDRIPYVYIETKKEPELQGERVETPEYIIKNKLKIDYLFYITNQIMIPSLKFLDLIIDNASNVFNEYIIKEENRKKCMMPIAYYAEKSSGSSDDSSDENFINFDELVSAPVIEKEINPKKKTQKRMLKKCSSESEDDEPVKVIKSMDDLFNSSPSKKSVTKKKPAKKTPKKSKKSSSDSDSSKDSKKNEKIYRSTGDLFS
jgi:hypothetical protein